MERFVKQFCTALQIKTFLLMTIPAEGIFVTVAHMFHRKQNYPLINQRAFFTIFKTFPDRQKKNCVTAILQLS